MRKIKTLMKQWAHRKTKDAVVKKANLKKMQKWRRMNRNNANMKFVSWCNKADQKPILNQFLKQHWKKKVFQTYKFTKSRLIEKLLSIQNLQKELKIEFNEKCKTFLKAMYSSSLKIQTNEELLLNESIQ